MTAFADEVVQGESARCLLNQLKNITTTSTSVALATIRLPENQPRAFSVPSIHVSKQKARSGNLNLKLVSRCTRTMLGIKFHRRSGQFLEHSSFPFRH
jgi:hypothetical protein